MSLGFQPISGGPISSLPTTTVAVVVQPRPVQQPWAVQVDHSWQWWEQTQPKSQPSTFLPLPPTLQQHSQRIDPLPDLSFNTHEQQRLQPLPVTFLPPPPALDSAHSQRIDPLPDYNQQWWAGFVAHPAQPITTLPQPPLLRQADQRIDPLPDLSFNTHEQQRLQPVPITVLLQPPLLRQRDQRIDPLPDYNQQWWAGMSQPPLASNYQPPAAPTQQESQRWDALPDYWQEWQAFAAPPALPVTVLLQPPLLRQRDQRVDPLPEYNGQWWEQFRTVALSTVLPPPPLINPQHSQVVVVLPVYDDLWYPHQRKWPVPVAGPIHNDAPPTRQPDQTIIVLPDHTYTWWEQFRIQPAKSVLGSAQDGVYGIYGAVEESGKDGLYRVQNNIAGYNVYVGQGILPDLTAGPTTFSLTLPISIPVTPPASGTSTFFVLVRKQDHYGLESQNEFYSTITIDSSGNLVLPAIPAPQNLRALELAGGFLRVLAQYPTSSTDQYPADKWKVWIKSTPPDVTVDTPVAIVNVSGPNLAYTSGASYAAGTWYVVVALYRTVNNTLSPTLSGTVTVHSPPGEVVAVPSGFDVEP